MASAARNAAIITCNRAEEQATQGHGGMSMCRCACVFDLHVAPVPRVCYTACLPPIAHALQRGGHNPLVVARRAPTEIFHNIRYANHHRLSGAVPDVDRQRPWQPFLTWTQAVHGCQRASMAAPGRRGRRGSMVAPRAHARFTLRNHKPWGRGAASGARPSPNSLGNCVSSEWYQRGTRAQRVT